MQQAFLSFFFLGPHLRHMEVARLGVKSELQQHQIQAASATYIPQLTAMPDPYPLSEAKDQTCNLMVPSQISFRCATKGTTYVSYTLAKLEIFFQEKNPQYLNCHHEKEKKSEGSYK